MSRLLVLPFALYIISTVSFGARAVQSPLKIGDEVLVALENGQTVNGTIVIVQYIIKTMEGEEISKNASLVTRLGAPPPLHPAHHPAQAGLLTCLFIIGGTALGVALGLSLYERRLKRIRETYAREFIDSPHGASGGSPKEEFVDVGSAKGARTAVKRLLCNWLVDPLVKWVARLACFLVMLLWTAREYSWAFILSKMGAEVINAISEVHETRDINRVYTALMTQLLWDMCLAVPLFWVMDPCVARFWDMKLRAYITRVALFAYIDGGGQAYYRIKLNELKNGIDNPDQRMTEDVNNICDGIYNVLSSILSSVLGCSMWIVVILHVANWQVCTIYFMSSFLRTSVALLGFGGSLTRSRQYVLMTAANLRYSLTRIRDSAEEIAFAKGDPIEYDRTSSKFQLNVKSLWQQLFVQIRYGTALGLLGYFPRTIMWLLLVPRILNGYIGLGDAIRVFQGMDQLDKIISFFVNNFEQFTELQANANRLHRLLMAADNVNKVSLGITGSVANEGSSSHNTNDIVVELQTFDTVQARHSLTARNHDIHPQVSCVSYIEPRKDVALALEDLHMCPPDVEKSIMMGGISITCKIGQALLFMGPSGLGKSSLVRTVFGLWPSGSGTVERPGGASSEFVQVVPSKSYIPIGTMLDIVHYPRNLATCSKPVEDLICEASVVLHRARLGHLCEKWGWDEVRDWRQLLSSGEQQRIGFARLFLTMQANPSNGMLAVLDEATGHLETGLESTMYEEVRKELSHGGGLCGLVSVGHRPTLLNYHESTCVLGELTEEQEQLLDVSSPVMVGAWQLPGGKCIPWKQLPLLPSPKVGH